MKRIFALCLTFILVLGCSTFAFGADMETMGYAEGIAGVYSSGNQEGNHVYNIFDGSLMSKWAHDAGPSVVWFKTDPNVTYDHVNIALTNGNPRHYRFELAVYTAAGEWEVVWDWQKGQLSSGTTDELERFDFTKPVSGEWLRFTGRGSDVNAWNNISEMTGVPLVAGPAGVVVYDNDKMAEDITVVTEGEKTYLPFIETAELQGFTVTFNEATQEVTAKREASGQEFYAKVGATTFKTHEGDFTTDKPLIVKDGVLLCDMDAMESFINYAAGLNEESHVYTIALVRATAEIKKAFAEMEVLFDKEKMTDLYINLYDPATGGFYFGTSAVGQPGYMPMIESTCQAYKPAGLVNDPEYKAKLGGWLQSMQDPDTGWFLEPMYTENYNVETVAHTKKQRNLFMTETALKSLGMKPLYLTPTERLVLEQEKAAEEAAASGKPAANTQTATADQEKITTANDAYLQSEEAYLEWVKTSYDWDDTDAPGLKSTWQAGNEVGDFTNQLKQLGYWDSVSEFIRSKQRPHNGLFTDDINIEGISAVTKLSGMFDTDHPMQYMDKIIESAAWLAENAEFFSGSEPYNVSLAIRYMVQTAGGMISEEEQQKINNAAPRFVRGLTAALGQFYKWDGGFGYLPTGTSTGSQGGHVIPAYDCSDVNGNQLAMGCLSDLYWIMGMKAPSRFNDERLEAGMRAKQPITEPLIKMPTAYNYEDVAVGDTPQGTSANNAVVVEDPSNWRNKAIRANMYKHWNVVLPGPCDFGEAIDTIEFSIMPGKIHVNNCGISMSVGQALELSLYVSNGSLSIYNRWDQSDINRDVIASGIKQWRWSDVRIEYDIIDKDQKLTEVRCYINGKLTGTSKNVFNGARDPKNWPQADVSWMTLQGWSWGHCELYFDNIRYSSRKAA